MFRRLNDAQIQYRAARGSGDKRGLLVVSSGGIGDSILFSLMIERFITLVGDDDPVTLVVRSESLGVGFLFPSRVNLIGVDYRRFIRDGAYKRQVCAELRALNVQIAISSDHLRLPTVDDVMVMATGAAQKFALRPRTWPKHDRALAQHEAWYTRWIDPDPAPAHRLIRWWELANALTGEKLPPPRVAFAADRLLAPVESSSPSQMRLKTALISSSPPGRMTLNARRVIRRWQTCRAHASIPQASKPKRRCCGVLRWWCRSTPR